MSLSFIKNQPVVFYGVDENPEDFPSRGTLDFVNLVDYDSNDKTYVQVKVAPVAGSSNFIGDSSFSTTTYWSTAGSGTIATNLATIGDGSSGVIYKSGLSLVTGDNYQLVINVTVIFGTMQIKNGSELIGTIESTGVHKLSFTASADSLIIQVIDSTSYVEFINVAIRNIPNDYALGILDEDLNPVAVITFEDNPEYFTLAKDTLTIVIDWTELAIDKGCYYIGITDPEQNNCTQFGVYNPEFYLGGEDDGVSDIIGWHGNDAANTTFEPSVPKAIIRSPVATANYIVNTRSQLCGGKTYTVTIDAFSGVTSAHLRLASGGTTTNPQTVTSTPATFVFTITPIVADYLRIISDNNLGDVVGLTINVTEVLIELPKLDWGFEFVTPDTYKVSSFVSENPYATKRISLFNNEDGLGFIFEGSNFLPTVRVPAKILNRKYDYQKEENHDDVGLKEVAYGELRVIRFLRIEHQPNYILDFMALFPIADHVYIDETEFYFEDDGFEPNYSDDLDNLATAEFNISDPQQNIRNTMSGETLSPPIDGGILTVDDDAHISEPASGDTIKILR